jgi:hypothetical protein
LHSHANYSNLKNKLANRNLTENQLLYECNAHVAAHNSSQETDQTYSISSSRTRCEKTIFKKVKYAQYSRAP